MADLIVKELESFQEPAEVGLIILNLFKILIFQLNMLVLETN